MGDLIRVGDRFDRWEALEDQTNPWTAKVMCKCDCGTKRKVLCDSLTRGGSRSCGCLSREKSKETAAKRIKHHIDVGDKFGRLTVLDVSDRRHVVCLCECGNTVNTPSVAGLVSGNSKSCGCYGVERLLESVREFHARAGHKGHSYHTLHAGYVSMVARCTDPAHEYWPTHGGAGIRVHQPWLDDEGVFIADIEAEIGPRVGKALLLRKDPSGNYEPGNMMWGTKADVNARRDRPRVLPLDKCKEAADMVEAGFRQYEVAELFQVMPSYIHRVMNKRRKGLL